MELFGKQNKTKQKQKQNQTVNSLGELPDRKP